MVPEKQIIITGSTGFMGSSLVKRLQSIGYKITEINRDLLDSRTSLVSVDVGSWERHGYIKNPYALIHLAGASVPSNVSENDKDQNILMTKSLLQYFDPQRFIFASTGLVYASRTNKHSEDSLVRPESAYGKSKLISEGLIIDKYQSKASILRIFNTIGPRMNKALFIPSLVRKIDLAEKTKKDLIEMDGHDGIRSFLDIRDLIDAITSLLSHKASLPSIMNLSSDEHIKLSDFADMLCKKMGLNHRFLFKQSTSGSINDLIGDNTLSKTYLGTYGTRRLEQSIDHLLKERS